MSTVSAEAASTSTVAAPPTSGQPWRTSFFVESALLLLSPLLVVWPLRAQLWATTSWIDSYLQTSVIQHGRDLLERFGANNRQFARAGLVVPGRLFDLVFGDIGGYLALRYVFALLAVVPAYLLFRRLHGRAAGAVAVAAVLANPVVLRAWGSDYGDSAAVAYLIAGTCALVMPASSRRARIGWTAAAGVALSLAVHSMFFSLPLIGVLIVVHLALAVRRDRRQALLQVAVLFGALVVTTGALVLLSKLLFGVADIFTPTWKAYLRLRMPDQVKLWHTPGRRWALDDPYLLVPPAVIASWAVVRLRRGIPVAELTIAAAALAQFAVYGYLQFVATEQAVEFYLYLSMLWPAVVLLSAFLVVAVGKQLLASRWTAWAVPVLVLIMPLALHPFRKQLMFRVPPTGLLLTVGIVAITLCARSRRVRRQPAAALILSACLVAGSFVLLTGKNTHKPWLPGQVNYPAANYAAVINTPYGQQRDEYAVASQLHHVVPTPDRPGVPLLMWWPRTFSNALNIAAAQYGWNNNALHRNMPALAATDAKNIRLRHPDYVVLLSDTGSQFPAAVAALERNGFRPSIARTAALRHGIITLFVQVLRLGPPARQ